MYLYLTAQGGGGGGGGGGAPVNSGGGAGGGAGGSSGFYIGNYVVVGLLRVPVNLGLIYRLEAEGRGANPGDTGVAGGMTTVSFTSGEIILNVNGGSGGGPSLDITGGSAHTSAFGLYDGTSAGGGGGGAGGALGGAGELGVVHNGTAGDAGGDGGTGGNGGAGGTGPGIGDIGGGGGGGGYGGVREDQEPWVTEESQLLITVLVVVELVV